MSYQYELHPIAQEEYIDSISWYLARSESAAANFVNAVEKGFIKVCNDPKRHHNVYKNYFEFNLQKYPFTIVYTVEESLQSIIIIAIYHQKRQPGNKYR